MPYFVFTILLACAFRSQAAPLDTAALVKIATRYNLPTPPKDAPLVLAFAESYTMLSNKSTSRDPRNYSPAFLLKTETNGDIVILRGTELQTLTETHERLWRPFSINEVRPKPGGYVAEFDRLSAFVCAVQLAMRGDEREAQQIWQRLRTAKSWHDKPWDDTSRELKDPSSLLGSCLFDYFSDQVLHEPARWPEIERQMLVLLNEFPALKSEQRSAVLADLDAAVQAKPATPGFVESLLLDWSRRPGTNGWLFPFFDDQDESDAPANLILYRGADAVPDLIALLNDHRITAHLVGLSFFEPARIGRVGELASILLEEITGIHPTASQVKPDAALFQAWLDRERKVGEEAMLVESVFTRTNNKITGVHETPVRIVARKFPEKLASLCNDFSKNASDEAELWPLSDALASASLPKEERVEALAAFAQKGSLQHKRCALQSLADLDEKRAAELFIPILDSLPRDSAGEYWTCPEAGVVHVVKQMEDDDVWRRCVLAAKRSSIGLRMEMMSGMDYECVNGKCSIDGKNRTRRLAFLTAFLNDQAVRNMNHNASKFDGPCAAFTIPRIAVRDFAAMEIAEILGLDDSPDEFWTSSQWKALRAKVAGKLATEKLPNLTGT